MPRCKRVVRHLANGHFETCPEEATDEQHIVSLQVNGEDLEFEVELCEFHIAATHLIVD